MTYPIKMIGWFIILQKMNCLMLYQKVNQKMLIKIKDLKIMVLRTMISNRMIIVMQTLSLFMKNPKLIMTL